jgi:predicted nucleic acid-binding protein
VVAPQEAGKLLRDPKDQPILNAAILAQVDIVISGDKHFLEARLEQPAVITVAQYCEITDLE